MLNIFMYYTPTSPDYYPDDLRHSSYKPLLTSREINSVYPDQMKPADMDLMCFLKCIMQDKCQMGSLRLLV